mmetsp:Transcript_3331/g.4888  ORF Transcript_3331/g.4888 Transcript_3331/m.4888 type:complete len:158 (-) Transcript_3331:404-877(-)|eukprot:CAMPEP_0113943882 /NCGR_PEP_ID=MMETSP1339-20121228/29209_1 /TAXON_ID=94617 /ORGANISM="Fibrocapsa japonica" /LENGTH=157 /DNA_ID=CAMNT_0000948867 /DNA_START=22 /DNA_END=495 /DNA_ORIENTATION=+ /assembly_acc=CAM_ASM_000762
MAEDTIVSSVMTGFDEGETQRDQPQWVVNIVEAKGLKQPGFGRLNPFIKLVQRDVIGQTAVQYNTDSPKFGEKFEVPATSMDLLTLECWDFNSIGAAAFVGKVVVGLREQKPSNWLELKAKGNKSAGYLQIKVKKEGDQEPDQKQGDSCQEKNCFCM